MNKFIQLIKDNKWSNITNLLICFGAAYLSYINANSIWMILLHFLLGSLYIIYKFFTFDILYGIGIIFVIYFIHKFANDLDNEYKIKRRFLTVVQKFFKGIKDDNNTDTK